MADRETFKRWLADRLFRIASWCNERAERLDAYSAPPYEPSPLSDRTRNYMMRKMLDQAMQTSVVFEGDRPMPKASGDVVHIRRPVIFEEKP